MLTLFSSLVRADVVTLKDGSTHEGTVVSENRAQVVLEIEIANIKTTKTFPRYKVRSIEYKPLEKVDEPETEHAPEETPESTAKESEPEVDNDPATVRSRPDPVMAMQLTIKGTLGEHFNSRGLKKALDLAVKEEIEHIVFFLDCDQGYLYDSLEMLRLFNAYDEHFSYYAFVNDDLPTSAYVFLAVADRVFLKPSVQMGGDMDYSNCLFGVDRITERPWRVDLPYREQWSDELREAAQRTKKPLSFFETDTKYSEQEVEVMGKPVFDERTGQRAVRRFDRFWVPETTGQEMINAGLGEPISGSVSRLGGLLGIEGWRVQGAIASRAMRADEQAAVRLGKRYKATRQRFQMGLVSLAQDDPRDSDYELVYQKDRDGTLRFDLDPIPELGETSRWQRSVERKILQYQDCMQAHKELLEIVDEGQSLGLKQALMPEIKEGYLEELRQQNEWFTEHRREIPHQYLKLEPDPKRP
ncbi:MAG: hypothetical protein ACF8MF_05225 [Phycisphaerales bacterium JB052]